jgi:hypothetical protein
MTGGTKGQRSIVRQLIAWAITAILCIFTPFAVVGLGSRLGFPQCNAESFVGMCSVSNRLAIAAGIFGAVFPDMFLTIRFVHSRAGHRPGGAMPSSCSQNSMQVLPAGLFALAGNISYIGGDRVVRVGEHVAFAIDSNALVAAGLKDGAHTEVICQRMPLGTDLIILAARASDGRAFPVGAKAVLTSLAIAHICLLSNMFFLYPPKFVLTSICGGFAVYLALILWRMDRAMAALL